MWEAIRNFFAVLFGGTKERPSSSDVSPDGSISEKDGVVSVDYNVGKTRIPFTKRPKIWVCPVYHNTNSEDPVFDELATNILLAGADEEEQRILVDWLADEWKLSGGKLANIVVYQTIGSYAIHRIYKIEQDAEGRKWYFKGDNNPAPDSGFARDTDIQWVLAQTIH